MAEARQALCRSGSLVRAGPVFLSVIFLLGSILTPLSSVLADQVVIRDCADCPPMVAIPAGDLILDGGHRHPVHAFLIGQTEVTFDQWQACVADEACPGGQDDHGWGRGTRPIINITLAQARIYAQWLSRKTGRTYRLPSEDEWEWAARGGTRTRFWWGDSVGSGHANCRHCGAAPWGGRQSAPVASFAANPYGLFDTAGNVWEWTRTCWGKDRLAEGREKAEQESCRAYVAKGGAWYYIARQSESASRSRQSAGLWSYTVGFRVAAEGTSR